MNERKNPSFTAMRIINAGLAAFLFLLLAGCSSLQVMVRGEPVTLRFAFLAGSADYTPLVEAYQADHPNITIELFEVPTTGGGLRNLSGYLAQSDAMRLPAQAISDQIIQALLPLDPMFSTDRAFPQDDLFPYSLQALQLDGRQVAVPAGIDPYVFFYIPQKFASAGLPEPSAGWRLEDFINIAMSMHNSDESLRGTDRFTYGFCTNPQLTDPIMMAYLFGGGLLDDPYMPTRPTLNIPANIDALTWYASLKTDFGLLPPVDSPRELGMQVAAGNCAFWMDLLDRATFGRYGKFEAEPLPLPAYNASFSAATLDGYAIMNSSQHPEEAWEWIRFLMGQESASGGLIPPLRSLVRSAEYTARVSEPTAALAQSLPDQMVVLGLEMYRDERLGITLEMFNQAAQQVISGDISPENALDLAQQQAEQRFR